MYLTGLKLSKRLKKQEKLEIRGNMEIIQTTELLRSGRILRRVLDIRGHVLFLKREEILRVVHCQITRPRVSQQEKRTCRIVEIAVPADHRVKLSKIEKKDKYLDLARELRKTWNMKVTVIPI